MPTLSDKIDGIYERVKELGTKLSHLRSDNQRLELENKSLKSEVSELQLKIAELDKKLSVNTRLNDEHRVVQKKNNKEMRREIDRYITKIDECIDLLNKN
jgi:chromosome segregation ATPase